MVVLLMIIVENSIMHFLNTWSAREPRTDPTNGAEMPIIFTLLVFGIIGPIIEEIIFRHILVNRFSEYVGTAIASIVSIIIFTLLHTNQLSDIAIYLPGTVMLTAAYLISIDPLHML